MTRKEAVLRLEVLKDFSQNNELKNMHEAIDMAIRSLEAWDKVDYLVNKTYWGFPIGLDYCLDMLTEIMEGVKDADSN